MRVGVKIPGWERKLKFDVNELEELQKDVAVVLGKKSGSDLPILSLNRSDPLTEEGFQSVVSGDTLWVLEAATTNPAPRQVRSDPSGAESSASCCSQTPHRQQMPVDPPRLCPELEACMSQKSHATSIPTRDLCEAAFASEGWRLIAGDAQAAEGSRLLYSEYEVPEKRRRTTSAQTSCTVSVWFDSLLPLTNVVHARHKALDAEENNAIPWSIPLPKNIKNDREVAIKHWKYVKDCLCMRVENLCILTDLPPELSTKCLEGLGPEDLVAVSLTCKFLYAAANSEGLWRKIWSRMGLGAIRQDGSYREAVANQIKQKKKNRKQASSSRHLSTIGARDRQRFSIRSVDLTSLGSRGIIGGDYDRFPSFNGFIDP